MNRRTMIKQSGLASTALALPFSLSALKVFNPMTDSKNLDVIIIGGSYAGLSAAMALGRALRKVLIIDSGKPCNQQTPHSHNFITQDGEKPAVIAAKAKEQVLQYGTVKFHQDLVVSAVKIDQGFVVSTQSGEEFNTRKLIFATGVKDEMPNINGFADCWGISIIHCPYCHGYEVKNTKTGILANGDKAMHYAQLISNWTKDLTIFTNGKAEFSEEQLNKLKQHNIPVIEKQIDEIRHENGQLKALIFADKSAESLVAIYNSPNTTQHSDIPEKLGCTINEMGLLEVNLFQKTIQEGVYACGDNTSPLRAVSYAVATGTIAGASCNNDLIEEDF